MIGCSRSFDALRRKKNKIDEGKKIVRSRMRLLARLYLRFRCLYDEQSNVKLSNPFGNTADLYNRETITVLGKTIDEMCEHESKKPNSTSISNQKSGLKISLLNLLKLTGKGGDHLVPVIFPSDTIPA